jgi:hypothetical protein
LSGTRRDKAGKKRLEQSACFGRGIFMRGSECLFQVTRYDIYPVTERMKVGKAV